MAAAKGEGLNTSFAPPIVHKVLRSPGQLLHGATRAFMESRFGHDFRNVRVHTDAQAANSARALDALAYTVGHDVVFGREQYSPSSTKGRQLLAHELAHVIQQSGDEPNTPAISGSLKIGPADGGLEQLARLQSSQALQGPAQALDPARSRVLVQRATESNGAPPQESGGCPTLPAATPGACAARHQAYAATVKCFPLNSWLPCVSRASGEVCRAVEAFSFRGKEGSDLETCVTLNGGDTSLTRAKGAWFDFTNACIWGHWRNAVEALNGASNFTPSNLTTEWADAVAICQSNGVGSDDCCRAQVVAEQTAIEACGSYDSSLFGKLPTDVPGAPLCSDLIRLAAPGIPFTGDFGNVKDRIVYGWLRCCSGL
jgi:hypothetical protein